MSFPKRNRIISGLSSATIVFEGRERSGALITARYAKEQERRVYALPASIGTKHSEVSNLLIKNGASLCTCADDIVNDFSKEYGSVINPFRLPKTLNVNMMEVLASLQISALCQSDEVFTPPRKARTKVEKQENISEQNASEPPKTQNSMDPPPNFDKIALKLYKKIPLEGECSIESLVDEELNLRDVMKALLKLEMNKFVILLPGEKVTRKSN